MKTQIDSRIFEIQDENSLKQLMTFLSLDIQIDGQRYIFKDDQQKARFLKFQSIFESLKGIFPNFTLQLKSNSFNNNRRQDQSLWKNQEDSLLKAQSTKDELSQNVKSLKEETIQNLSDMPRCQIDINSVQESNQNAINQKQTPLGISSALQKFYLEEDQQDCQSLSNYSIDQSNRSLHQFSDDSQIMSQVLNSSLNIFDDQIKIKFNDQSSDIQLKNNYILQIIEQLYLENWNQLIEQLNLIKQSMNCYKSKLNTDFYYLNQEIQAFIETIQLIDIQFCFYSCYTMKESQSKMNKFLQFHQIQIGQIGDDFFFVSRLKSQEFLKDIILQINENYRGYILYFASLKPYINSFQYNPILEKSRYLFYKNYLSTDVKQYSFNQYFNESYFFIEMNFQNIKENRELVEKYIKEYVGGFFKNLFLISFQFQASQDIVQQVEKIFQNGIEYLKLKILFYKNNDDFILFGINEDILRLIYHLEEQELKKYQITQIKFEIDEQNYLFKLKGAQQKIDLRSVKNILKDLGFQSVSKLLFSQQNNDIKDCLFLMETLKFICNIRGQNCNRTALQTIHKRFRNSIEQKELNKELTFLNYKNSNNVSCELQQKEVITLNVRSELQQFPISQTISLDPPFLDEIIQENYYQEFQTKLVQKFQKIQFQKISHGKYQLQCPKNEIVIQFKQFFEQFQSVTQNLDNNSLYCFELSHYLKQELKKRQINYKIVGQKQLCLISRNNESFKYAQEFKYYQGAIIHILSLNSININEKIDYYSLVLARTNFLKYKMQKFLKQVFPYILEIEFREELEISSFCVIHSICKNQAQRLDTFIEQIRQIIRSMIFIEIITTPEIGKKIHEKIQEISDLYLSQKQQYSDYYITILGNIKKLQQINQLIQKIETQNKQETMVVSFYIEQIIPYQNIVQKAQCQEKFKTQLENHGYSVINNKNKWQIEIKQQLSKITLFSQLTEEFNQHSNQIQEYNKQSNINYLEISEIKQQFSVNSSILEQTLVEYLEKENSWNDQNNIQQQIRVSNQKNSIQIIPQLQASTSYSEIQSEVNEQDYNKIQKQGFIDNFDLLAEFQSNVHLIQPPANSKLTLTLQTQFPSQSFIFLQPYVDQTYKNYFENLTSDFIELYVIQKLDKVYKESFSKKMLYYINPKNVIQKFIQQNNQNQSTLICFKVNKNCSYSYVGEEKDKICLVDDNQVLPYFFLKKK